MGKGSFIDDTGIRKADCETAERTVRVFSCEAEHCSRVNAATQKKSDWNLADHVQSARLIQKSYDFGFCFAKAYIPGREIQIPILPNSGAAIPNHHARPRSEFEDVLE